MYSFNIVLTEKCNISCPHCYMSCSHLSNGRTMSKENITTIIKRLPLNTRKVVLTGGEVFCEKELLFYAIKTIRKHYPDVIIELESNGKYIYSKEDIKVLLTYLKTIGVNSIVFSDDPFHQQGGVDLLKVRKIKEYEDNNTPKIKYLILNKALEIGRARNLDDNKVEKRNCMNNENTTNNPYFFVDVEGFVYLCAWKIIPHIGNIIYEQLSDILFRLKEEFNSLILRGEILKAININHNPKENQKIVNDKGECMLCYTTFSRKKK